MVAIAHSNQWTAGLAELVVLAPRAEKSIAGRSRAVPNGRIQLDLSGPALPSPPLVIAGQGRLSTSSACAPSRIRTCAHGSGDRLPSTGRTWSDLRNAPGDGVEATFLSQFSRDLRAPQRIRANSLLTAHARRRANRLYSGSCPPESSHCKSPGGNMGVWQTRLVRQPCLRLAPRFSAVCCRPLVSRFRGPTEDTVPAVTSPQAGSAEAASTWNSISGIPSGWSPMAGTTSSFPTPTICEDSESPARTPDTARIPSTASATWPWIWLARYQDSGTGITASMSERRGRHASHAIAGSPEATAGGTRAHDQQRARRLRPALPIAA